MAPTRTIDVQDFMNPHKLSSYQIRIIALCFLIVAIDGFDTAAIGFIAPALRAEWGVTAAQLAPLFGAGLFGLMVGRLHLRPPGRQNRPQVRSSSSPSCFFGVRQPGVGLGPPRSPS